MLEPHALVAHDAACGVELMALTDHDTVAGVEATAGAARTAGIGFVARYNLRDWPGVVAVLPMLAVGALPCWLAVHREIRSNPLVRMVYDFLASEIPPLLRD